MAVSPLQPLKNLNASYNRILAGEGLSFELSRVILIFHDNDLANWILRNMDFAKLRNLDFAK